jgi:cytochrome oxidase assembly protein ShyY1
MLVDNVINRGVAGYKVLTPFKISNSDTLILVDRGWIPREASRQTLPNIDINNIKEKVFGTLENPELGFVLSDILVSGDWPKVSQTKNLNVISKEYNDPLAQFILVADPILKNSLEYLKIIPTNMMPSKHYGYSAQWFTMFLVLCFMYIWLGYKKNEK